MKIIVLWVLYLTVCFWVCFSVWKKYRKRSTTAKQTDANVAPYDDTVVDADFEFIDEKPLKQRLLKVWERIKAWSKKPKPKKKQRDLSWVKGAVVCVVLLGVAYFFVAEKIKKLFATNSLSSDTSLFTDVWNSTWVRFAIGAIVLVLITWLIIRLVKRKGDKTPRKADSVLNIPGKFWDEHKKALLGTFFGILFFNLFLAYVEPFTAWHKSFRDTGSNFWWINTAIFFATLMVATIGGDTGKKLSQLAWGLTAIALITFTWNYFEVGSKVKSVANSVSGFFSSETANAQGRPATATGTGKKFEGNARDYEPFKGPERDSVMEHYSLNPMMADVAAAESQFHHWKPSVNRDSVKPGCDDVVKGKVNSDGSYALGVMQIKNTHKARADSLGIDICTLEGNMKFADLLIKEHPDGRDWAESAPVWRDHYVSVPESKKDLVGGSQSSANSPSRSSGNDMEVSFTKTGTDGPWSEWIDTKGCKLDLRGVNHRNISMQGEDMKIYSLDPDYTGEPIVIPNSRRWRFRSNTEIQTEIRMEITC